MLAERTVHVHFKTHEPEPAAEAARMDYPACLEALRQAGYTGDFSVEYEGPGDGLAAAAAGRELLARLWGG
jgi:sugar phosphate isomerase/epimerase